MKSGASTMRKRILIAFVALAAVFCALFGRLFYLQVIDGNWLRAKASEQWYRDLPLKAPRGDTRLQRQRACGQSRRFYAVCAPQRRQG